MINNIKVFILFIANISCSKEKRGRVVGGSNVRSVHEFPMYVSILDLEDVFCGGTILDATNVLTAAHCGVTPGTFIRYGSITREMSSSDHLLKVTKVLNHPKAEKDSGGLWSFDVSILTLEQPIPLSRKAIPTAFGSQNEFDELVQPREAECLIVGMGRSGVGGGRSYKAYLQKGTQVVDEEYSCDTFLKSKPPTGMCFLTKGPDASSGCPGDSGGPLFCKIDGKYKQFGVGSFAGQECNTVTGWWAPYSVMDWILQNTDEIDLENPGHVITGMELVLASIGSIVGGIVLTLTAVLAFRYYRMKKNAYPHTNRPLPKTPI